ncbi:hypothetical protein BX666DRAFT_1881404 [Dichotomocladium elegans]|nr:hypothetical protein BX666DRAFT_1881404 [Dichotomocladium elegans]
MPAWALKQSYLHCVLWLLSHILRQTLFEKEDGIKAFCNDLKKALDTQLSDINTFADLVPERLLVLNQNQDTTVLSEKTANKTGFNLIVLKYFSQLRIGGQLHCFFIVSIRLSCPGISVLVQLSTLYEIGTKLQVSSPQPVILRIHILW